MNGGLVDALREAAGDPRETGYHRHKCHFCGFVYEHHDCNDVSHGDYGAHECPGCHRCGWGMGIYTGDEPPRVRNGRVPAGH